MLFALSGLSQGAVNENSSQQRTEQVDRLEGQVPPADNKPAEPNMWQRIKNWFIDVEAGEAEPPESVSVVEPSEIRCEDVKAGSVCQDTLHKGGLGPEMVVISSGSFLMGEYRTDKPNPSMVRKEDVQDRFAIGKYEITVAEFQKFVDASGYQTQAETNNTCKALSMEKGHWVRFSSGKHWRKPGFIQDGFHPVVCVSWNDAQAYVKWLSEQTGEEYRLPTEVEWEYVAREGANASHYWTAQASGACQYANIYDKSATSILKFDWPAYDCYDNYIWTAPVGRYQANKFGVYDMLGNVWEWVQDCYKVKDKKVIFLQDLIWEDCESRVLKGGSWHYGPGVIYAGLRAGIEEDKSGDLDGFRVARNINP